MNAHHDHDRTDADLIAALREMDRVRKSDGTIRLVERGRSDVGPVATYREWRADAHYAKTGRRWTREPREIVPRAGLRSTGLFGIVATVEIAPNRSEQR